MIAQSNSEEDSSIGVIIDEKQSVQEIMFLVPSRQKHSRRISGMSIKYFDTEKQFCLDFYCSVYPRPLAIDVDGGFVDCDLRRLR